MIKTLDKFSKFGYNYLVSRERSVMTIRQSSAKSLTVMVIALLALIPLPKIVFADTTTSGGLTSLPSTTNFIDPNTKLRTMRKAPGMNSDGTPSAPYQGNPGCNQNVMSSMSNVANFHYGQNVAVQVNTRQQPTSFSNCLTDLINNISSLNDMFENGFSLSGLINVAFTKASQGIIDKLETEACTSATKAAYGAIAKVNRNYTLLNAGGVVISMNPADQALVCPSGSTMMQPSGPCCAQGNDPNTGQPYLTNLSDGSQTCTLWTSPVRSGSGAPVSP